MESPRRTENQSQLSPKYLRKDTQPEGSRHELEAFGTCPAAAWEVEIQFSEGREREKNASRPLGNHLKQSGRPALRGDSLASQPDSSLAHSDRDS